MHSLYGVCGTAQLYLGAHQHARFVCCLSSFIFNLCDVIIPWTFFRTVLHSGSQTRTPPPPHVQPPSSGWCTDPISWGPPPATPTSLPPSQQLSVRRRATENRSAAHVTTRCVGTASISPRWRLAGGHPLLFVHLLMSGRKRSGPRKCVIIKRALAYGCHRLHAETVQRSHGLLDKGKKKKSAV